MQVVLLLLPQGLDLLAALPTPENACNPPCVTPQERLADIEDGDHDSSDEDSFQTGDHDGDDDGNDNKPHSSSSPLLVSPTPSVQQQGRVSLEQHVVEMVETSNGVSSKLKSKKQQHSMATRSRQVNESVVAVVTTCEMDTSEDPLVIPNSPPLPTAETSSYHQHQQYPLNHSHLHARDLQAQKPSTVVPMMTTRSASSHLQNNSKNSTYPPYQQQTRSGFEKVIL